MQKIHDCEELKEIVRFFCDISGTYEREKIKVEEQYITANECFKCCSDARDRFRKWLSDRGQTGTPAEMNLDLGTVCDRNHVCVVLSVTVENVF